MTLQPLDRCSVCGFDGQEWEDRDAVRTIVHLADFYRLWTEPAATEQRWRWASADRDWTVVDYVDHVAQTTVGVGLLVAEALADPGADLGPAADPGPATDTGSTDLAAAIAGLDAEANRLAAALRAVPADRWRAGLTIGGRLHSIRWAAIRAVHDGWHHLRDVAILVAEGRAGIDERGVVTQISRSDGGVPKLPIERATVGRRGIEGDVQAARAHHGRPYQAVCLWSAEVIETLAAEGHPIAAGNAGENITIRGVDWSALHGGAVLELGPDIRVQLSAPATPCAKNNRWFHDGDSRRIDHDRHPGSSRWYASVLRPGELAVGDAVAVGPAM